MESKVVENLTDAGINLAHLTHEVSKSKVLIDDVLEDGKRKAERGFVAAEDCVEDTTYFIKRHPWQSVGAAVGVGAAIGLLAGWLTARTCAMSRQS